MDILLNRNTIQTYGGSTQDLQSTVTVDATGSILSIVGNGWKKIALPYTITPNTILEFDFKSTHQGEVQGIGFDKDNVTSSDYTFELYGTQSWGINDFKNYQGSAGSWKHYKIPVGKFYTGAMSYLTFTNDQDIANPNAESSFANLKVYEVPPANPGPPPSQNLPALSILPSPASNPALPAGADFFNPSFNGTVDSQSPIISEWTRTAGPGETIVLTGWKFSQLSGSQFGSDTKFWVYGQTQSGNGVLAQAKIQKLSGDVASITLPTNLPKGSEYLVWAENSAGTSKPVALNQTEAWWVGPDAASRGEVTSIFGRNLSQDGGTGQSNVYIEDATGKGYWAQVVAVNPYKIDFKVPSGLANGSYKVWVHNGDGGKYGWSKPVTLTVNNGLNYTGTTFNVKNFGAKGDGVTDDTQAIKKALAAADQADWATVYLPAGKYVVKDTLFPGGDKVRWLGDGKDLTTIKAANGFAKTSLFAGSQIEQITFQNLTLDANSSNTSNLNTVTLIRDSSDLQYLNVKINTGASPFDWHDNNRVSMKNSEIISGEPAFLGTAKQVLIDGTKFWGINYNDAFLLGFVLQKLSITNSIAQNLDKSNPNNGKWAKGRFFADQAHWGISQYQYFGGNQTIDMAPPQASSVDQNSGEQIMWETEATASFGAPTAATANTVKFGSRPNVIAFESASSVDESWSLTVVGGKGIGQTRQVKSVNQTTNTYEINGQWDVLPDQSSIIVGSKMTDKVVVYDNQLDGTPSARDSWTASAGVQTWHGATNLIIDDNSFRELRTAVSLWSGRSNYFMPVHFAQITDNEFKDDLTGILLLHGGNSARKGTAFLGSIIRNNDLDHVGNAFEIDINPSSGSSVPNANMNVFEKNTLSAIGDFTSFGGSVQNNIFLQNSDANGNVISL